MAKVEIDLLDPSLDNSGDGDEEILGLVDDSTFNSGEAEKKLLESGGQEISYSNYYREPPGNAVAYRLVVTPDDNSANTSQTQPQYISTTSMSGGQAVQPIQTVLANSVNGQIYVIGNSDVFSGSSNKQTSSREIHGKVPAIIKKRDDRRRATHNEVERRRRDKINNWIIKLAKLIPRNDTTDKIGMESKGGILAKACEYIGELKDWVDTTEKTNKKLAADFGTMMVQFKALKKNNMQMRNLLNQHGITFNPEASDSGS